MKSIQQFEADNEVWSRKGVKASKSSQLGLSEQILQDHGVTRVSDFK